MGKHYEQTHTALEAKTCAGRRAIEARLPKIIETPKNLLALKGHSTSVVCTAVLNEIHMLKKPLCKKLQRKNELLPFEAGGESHLENLSRLNDCSLFALVNHSKKRPHNLVLGRTFGFRILDMAEFGITNYVPSAAFPNVKSAPGSKPLILFNGDDFDATSTARNLKSLLLDIFRGADDAKAVNLAGIDRVIVFTLKGESTIMFRQYSIGLRKSPDSSLPRVVLTEAGPKFDLLVRRTQPPPDSLLRDSMRKPKDPGVVRKVKNVSRDDMGDKKGRVHVGRQDLSNMALARMKGLKKKRSFHSVEEGDGEKEKKEEGKDTQQENEVLREELESPPSAKRPKS